MTVIAYRYRAYPNAGQRELLARHFGCKRKVFNLYLDFLSQEEKVLLARKDVGEAEQAADPPRAVLQETVSKTELRSEPEADASQTSAFEGSREGCFNRAKGKTETSPKGLRHSAVVGSQEASPF